MAIVVFCLKQRPEYNYTEGVDSTTNTPGVVGVVMACLQFCNLYPM